MIFIVAWLMWMKNATCRISKAKEAAASRPAATAVTLCTLRGSFRLEKSRRLAPDSSDAYQRNDFMSPDTGSCIFPYTEKC